MTCDSIIVTGKFKNVLKLLKKIVPMHLLIDFSLYDLDTDTNKKLYLKNFYVPLQ